MLQQYNQFILLQVTSMSVELKIKYEVKNILKKRMINRKAHDFVKWKEYDALESIWELKNNLFNCVRML